MVAGGDASELVRGTRLGGWTLRVSEPVCGLGCHAEGLDQGLGSPAPNVLGQVAVLSSPLCPASTEILGSVVGPRGLRPGCRWPALVLCGAQLCPHARPRARPAPLQRRRLLRGESTGGGPAMRERPAEPPATHLCDSTAPPSPEYVFGKPDLVDFIY